MMKKEIKRIIKILPHFPRQKKSNSGYFCPIPPLIVFRIPPCFAFLVSITGSFANFFVSNQFPFIFLMWIFLSCRNRSTRSCSCAVSCILYVCKLICFCFVLLLTNCVVLVVTSSSFISLVILLIEPHYSRYVEYHCSIMFVACTSSGYLCFECPSAVVAVVFYGLQMVLYSMLQFVFAFFILNHPK